MLILWRIRLGADETHGLFQPRVAPLHFSLISSHTGQDFQMNKDKHCVLSRTKLSLGFDQAWAISTRRKAIWRLQLNVSSGVTLLLYCKHTMCLTYIFYRKYSGISTCSLIIHRFVNFIKLWCGKDFRDSVVSWSHFMDMYNKGMGVLEREFILILFKKSAFRLNASFSHLLVLVFQFPWESLRSWVQVQQKALSDRMNLPPKVQDWGTRTLLQFWWGSLTGKGALNVSET